MKIPNNGQIRQFGTGDIYSELYSTCNIDLDTNPGKIKLSRPFTRVASDDDLSSDSIEAFTLYSDNAYALTKDTVYKSTDFNNWTVGTTDIPNNAQDLAVFDGELRISGSTDIGSWDFDSSDSDNWWTVDVSGAPLTPGVPHIMEVDYGGSEALIVTDGSIVRRYEASSDTHYQVDIDSTHTATIAKPGIRSVWIGSYTTSSDSALVYQWDGASDDYRQAFPVGAKAVLAMEMVEDVPYIITERGEIKAFNNVAFQTVAQLPFSSKPLFASGVSSGKIQTPNGLRPVHPKGMRYQGGILYIFTNFEDDSRPLDDRSPNGIWCYNVRTGSLHNRSVIDGDKSFLRSSPLMVINDPRSRFFVGPRRILPGSTDNGNGIWIENMSADAESEGYFVLPEMTSTGLTDSFDEAHFKALLGNNDSIVIKYRGTDYTKLPYTCADTLNWLDDQTLTTTEDLSAVKAIFDAGEKLEIEILFGSRITQLSEVKSIEASAKVYKITLENAIGVSGEVCAARFDNWAEHDTYSEGPAAKIGLGDVGTFTQVKAVLTGRDGYPEIREVSVSNKSKTK